MHQAQPNYVIKLEQDDGETQYLYTGDLWWVLESANLPARKLFIEAFGYEETEKLICGSQDIDQISIPGNIWFEDIILCGFSIYRMIKI